MHLSYSTSNYKGQTYKSYSIAESYREGKKVRKRTLWTLGKLTDIQAAQIRMICNVVKNEEQIITQLKDIVVKETKAYLDIAVVNELWNQWQLDKAFNCNVTDSRLPTHVVAKLLTINRCTDPCSHYSIPAWVKRNALEDVLKIDLSGLNDDKIYYELDKIHKNKVSIENHIFNKTYGQNPESYDFIDYDLTTSYFVGYKCNLSAFGKGKAECHGRRQVLLSVLINEEGYPFKWDVFPGNKAEVKTLKDNIDVCKTRFKLNNKNITIVFDRGIISEDNAILIEEAEMKYISALDRNQIPSCGVSMKPFSRLSITKDYEGNAKLSIPIGFKKFDDQLFYKDGVVTENKRFIVGFNPGLFIEDRNIRTEKIAFFEEYLKAENKNLLAAKRERKADPTKNRIVGEMKRLKIRKYFEPPILKPISVQKKLKNGAEKSIDSFQVEVEMKEEIIKTEMLSDGVCVFVTNHTVRQGRGFKLKSSAIIQAYRNKTKIEDVFKNVKSFLKLRPFFVNTEEHVKAVYTICVISYFINKYLSNQRRALGEKDYLNSKELFAPFKDIDIATLADKNTGLSIKRAAEISPGTRGLLEKLGMSHITLG
jgi:transposase